MRKRVEYFKCVTCKRSMPLKYGELTNDGFKCNKHNKKYVLKVMYYACGKCGRKVIKDLIDRDITSGKLVCCSCSGDTTIRERHHGVGKNYGEHMSRKRHRLMKKKNRYY